LAAIWEEVLGRTGIGLEDNFFALGGHSLKATRLVSHIYKHFHVKLPLREVFAQPLLAQQVAFLQAADKTAFVHISPAPEQESYPLSSAQRRLWILSQLEEASLAYHMPGNLAAGRTPRGSGPGSGLPGLGGAPPEPENRL
jgi:acyl carrier protein